MDGGTPVARPTRFGFLFYVNRSGSTLFSRLLSEASPDLFVFPEVGFPLTLLIERRLGRVLAGDRLLRLILADPRRDSLAVSDGTLAQICAETTSCQLELLLTRIAAACHGGQPRAALLKLESLLYVAADIEAAFTRPAFFHLVRDPRAVASSMLRTPVPEKPGFTMARGSIWYAATHWRRYVAAVDDLAQSRAVTEFRYEALAEPEAACASVLSGLGLEPRQTHAAETSYRIGAVDEALHKCVFDDPDPTRSIAWRRELDAGDARVVELLCADSMARRGYDPGPPRSARDDVLLRRARAAHRRAMARHVVRTAGSYLRRNPSALLRRLVLAMRRNPARR